MKKTLRMVVMVKIVVVAVSILVDLIKDSLILVEISLSQGSFLEIMKQPKPYIRWVLKKNYQ